MLFFFRLEYSFSVALTQLKSKRAFWIELGSKELTKAWGEVRESCYALALVSMGWVDSAGAALAEVGLGAEIGAGTGATGIEEEDEGYSGTT